ncbi:glycoside hydrolase family 97 protein [Olivibacter sp. XZL3]|uniref:glycoside hydrolase family 97 protein n=1 Tax=Olivibacter sp. XZL3 TaxID=1735116 RepID=UPI001064F1D4|nr:glycoside hydrolase family 97 protein [Olivibacter sp. XZL3]
MAQRKPKSKWVKLGILFVSSLLHWACTSSSNAVLKSPDGSLSLTYQLDDKGQLWYQLSRNDTIVLDSSQLGAVLSEADFSEKLKLTSDSLYEGISDDYVMLNAKRKQNHYRANGLVLKLQNEAGRRCDIIFQLANDGLAFRYFFADIGRSTKVEKELTSYHLPAGSKAWLQPVAIAKSGWEQTNPSYEEHYEQDIPVGTPEKTGTGWVYPSLFKSGNSWLLITEAALDSSYCATRLAAQSPGGIYRVAFPDSKEEITKDGVLPHSDKPFYSPWRVVTVGGLSTLVESTLGTDVASPAKGEIPAFVKPGKAAWSWINSKDDFITYDEQKRYIDFAAQMKWQYCLIDVNWDDKIGYDKIAELARYADQKGVGLILWYNSAGDWNTVKYTPKGKLLTHSDRIREFDRLKQMGVKGIKVDFFGGDGQSVIKYYQDILDDAADYQLLVNFHGATLPRGWARTYPHLMTAEAVRGFEMVTFGQEDADKEATHAAMLPFTRNAFDPMDFTPMNLYKIQSHVQRKTTSAFELATSVLFLSGIQHYAESPSGMAHIAEGVQDLLRTLPDSWDDIKFIEGYPGKYVVVARKSGESWYVAGINGEEQAKELKLRLSFVEGKQGELFADEQDGTGISQQTITATNEVAVSMKASGGFLMKF